MHLPDLNIAKDRTSKENKYITLNEKYESVFKGKKYFLRTYGCQMNVHDSEAIRSYLEELGFKGPHVDIIVIDQVNVYGA